MATPLIILCGQAGSGKDTAASSLAAALPGSR
jgi:predicted kinase